MEGDGPTGPMVIWEYLKLKTQLESKLLNKLPTSLMYPIHYAMPTRVKKYLAKATSSHALLMATMLPPSLRAGFFHARFGPQYSVTTKANKLLDNVFHNCKVQLEQIHLLRATPSQPWATPKSVEYNNDAYGAMLHLHDAQRGYSPNHKLTEYQLVHDSPSQYVAMGSNLALKWWQVSSFPILFFF